MGRTTPPAAATAAAGSPTPRTRPKAKPKTITVGGVTVTVPTVMPAGFLWIIASGDDPDDLGPKQLVDVLEMLLTPGEIEQIKTSLPLHEIGPLVRALIDEIEAPGESQASPAT